MHPILFKIGPLIIYSYGVIVSISFALCTYLIWYNAPLRDMPRTKVLDLVITILISGIIGARLLHVISNFDYYKNFPLEIIMLNKGGLAFYGGLIASFISGIIYLKINSIHIWQTADLIAPYIALGQAIGRIGCFLNGCCYGIPVSSNIIGVIFPEEGVLRYPTQIYATIILLFIYMALRFMLQKNILKYNLFFVYLMMYSFQRFLIDFLRGDLQRIFLYFTSSQIISIIIFFISFGIFIWRLKASHGKA